MFENRRQRLTPADVAALPALLADVDVAVDDAVRIDLLRAAKEAKAALAALQIRLTAAFTDSQRRQQFAAGVRRDRAETGIAARVGLARRISPYAARRQVGWSTVMLAELPAAFVVLAADKTTERRAFTVAKGNAAALAGAPAPGRPAARRPAGTAR